MRGVLHAARFWLVLVLFLLLLTGCGGGSGSTVSGSVTVDGKPLDDGYISFYPAPNTPGPTTGGEIKGGKYTVRGVAIGKNRAEITAQSNAPVASSMGEAIKVKTPPQKPAIPSDAVGANKFVTITAGNHTEDFNIETPKRR